MDGKLHGCTLDNRQMESDVPAGLGTIDRLLLNIPGNIVDLPQSRNGIEMSDQKRIVGS